MRTLQYIKVLKNSLLQEMKKSFPMILGSSKRTYLNCHEFLHQAPKIFKSITVYHPAEDNRVLSTVPIDNAKKTRL